MRQEIISWSNTKNLLNLHHNNCMADTRSPVMGSCRHKIKCKTKINCNLATCIILITSGGFLVFTLSYHGLPILIFFLLICCWDFNSRQKSTLKNNLITQLFFSWFLQTFLQLLKMILSFLVSKSRISEGFRRDSLAKYEQVTRTSLFLL